MRGQLDTPLELFLAGCPVVVLYLTACTLTALSRRAQPTAPVWRLLVLAMVLAAFDQVAKIGVEALIGHQVSIPVIHGLLHLTNEHNVQGSWMVALFAAKPLSILLLASKLLVAVLLLWSIPAYHYYVATQRKSLWAKVAFVGLLSGLASWLCDMSFRGYVVDYIELPGLVSTDVKDILVLVGGAALIVEALDSPNISLRWRGWRQERDDLLRLARGLSSYAVRDLERVHMCMKEALLRK